MALTNRERMIMILAGASIVILIADQYLLGPVIEKRRETSELRRTLEAEVQQGLSTLEHQKILKPRWNQMQQAGLSSDIRKVEGLVFRFLEDASARAYFELTSIQPESVSAEDPMGQLEFMVSGTGTLDAVTQFLWDIEMADIPIKIDSMQLGSNDEDAKQMNLQMKLSSIYLVTESDNKEDQS